MNSPFTIGSTSSHGSGTATNLAISYMPAVEGGQGMLTFRDDAPLLSLLDPATKRLEQHQLVEKSSSCHKE